MFGAKAFVTTWEISWVIYWRPAFVRKAEVFLILFKLSRYVLYVTCYSAHSPLGLFVGRLYQVLRLLLTWTSYFYDSWDFTFLSVFILTHPVNFPVGENRSARKNSRLSAVLTNSFHMSGALSSSNIENVLTENRTRNLRGERRALWPLPHRSPTWYKSWNHGSLLLNTTYTEPPRLRSFSGSSDTNHYCRVPPTLDNRRGYNSYS